MNLLNAQFVLGAKSPGQFPQILLPETAFIGRSNVGKSSLLNSILMRKNLAKTSSTPGKTREINFFTIEDKNGKPIWSFADLPGFGYAVVSKEERKRFTELNFAYLSDRENLKLVCMLADSRHDPMEYDLALIEWLENHSKPFVIILTKTDKISKIKVENRMEQFVNLLKLCKSNVDVLPYSVVTGAGRAQLTAIIKKNCK